MLSTIVKLLTWVEHEIYKRFHLYYIEVSDSVKIQVLISAHTAYTAIYTITASSLRYISYIIYLLILRLMLNTISLLLKFILNILIFSFFLLISFSYIKKTDTFIVHYHALIAHLSSFKEIMHLCKKCTTQNLTC